MQTTLYLPFILTNIVLTSLVLSAPAKAEERPDVLVREDFFAAVMLNDMARLEKGMQKAEAVLSKDPSNARMMVWQGAGIFFSASAAFKKNDFQAGRQLQEKGLARMQQAVDLAPSDVNVLVARGAALINSTRYMPPQVARPMTEAGIGDYERTLQIQQPSFQDLSSHSKGELLLGLADGWLRLGNLEKARSYFVMMSTDAGLQGTVYENKARAWLDDKPESKTREFFLCSGCHKMPKD